MTDNSAEDHPYLVGLTGGIGSGKSTIAAFFSELGVEVVDADTIARSVLNVYPELLQEIFAAFGTDVKNSDGTLNRRKLGRIVFADHKKLDQLEQILHPKIRFLLLSHAYKATSAYVIVMVPLLFEKSLDVLMDRVLCIDLEEESQVTRTIERDGTTEDYVRLVMKRQISRWERRRRSQDILYNSGTEKFKRQLVRKFHDFYLSEAEK